MAGLSIKAQLGYKRTVVFALSDHPSKAVGQREQRSTCDYYASCFHLSSTFGVRLIWSRHGLKGTGEVLDGSPDARFSMFSLAAKVIGEPWRGLISMVWPRVQLLGP
jgi:hypothetical protein